MEKGVGDIQLNVVLDITADLLPFAVHSRVITAGISAKSLSERLSNLLMSFDRMRTSTGRRVSTCIGLCWAYIDQSTFTTVQSRLPDLGFIQAISEICKVDRAARLRPYLTSVVYPRLIRVVEHYAEQPTGDADQTVSVALGCLETVLTMKSLMTSTKIIPPSSVTRLIPVIAKLMQHDPNHFEPSDDLDDEYYSEDEDTSWKVRKAALRLATAVVATRNKSSVWIENIEDFSESMSLTCDSVVLTRLGHETEDAVSVELVAYLHARARATDLSAVISILKGRKVFTEPTRKSHAPAHALIREIESIEAAGVVGPIMPDVQTFECLSDLSSFSSVEHQLEVLGQLRGKLQSAMPSCVDESVLTLINSLTKMITVDKSLINEIDLGPFKHKEDSGAPIRKLAITCILEIVSVLKQNPQIQLSPKLSPSVVLRAIITAITISLDIDLSNSGDELYPLSVILLANVVEMNGASAVAAIPVFLGKFAKLVATCPVGKRGGDESALNPIGIVFGHLFLSIADLVDLKAGDEGVESRVVVHRDYPVMLDILKNIDKEGSTVGSILQATRETVSGFKRKVM